LTDPAIEFLVKKHLALIFEYVLMIYQAQETSEEALEDFFNNLFSQFQTHIQSPNLNTVKGSMLVCASALYTIRHVNFLAKIFHGIANLFCKLAEGQISLISKDLMAIAAMNASQLTLDNP
jgi:hypothetical protein